jgi:hypothetical protein
VYPCCEYALLWAIQPLPLLSLTPHLPPLSFQQLLMYKLMSSTFTDVFYDIVDALAFSFLFSPSPSSTEQFHYYRHVLLTSLHMLMFVFVYMFIFWIYLKHAACVFLSPAYFT